MVLPRYSSWIVNAWPEEQEIVAMKITIMPAIYELSDGVLLTKILTNNPWVRDFCSHTAFEASDTAYRTSPNDMTIVLLEFVDAYYGTDVTVHFQRRISEELVERYR